MRRNSVGSLMLEYAIYSGIVSFLALAATHGAWLMLRNVRAHQARQQIALEAVTLVNVFTHDIWQALPERWGERKIEKNAARWSCNNYEVGWVLKGTDLFRVIGNYDRVRGRWHASHRSLIVRYIESFAVHEHMHGFSKERGGVSCVVVFHHAYGKKEISWTVANRIGLC